MTKYKKLLTKRHLRKYEYTHLRDVTFIQTLKNQQA